MRPFVRSTGHPAHLILVVLILTFTAGINSALFALIAAADSTPGMNGSKGIYVAYRRNPSGSNDTFAENVFESLRDSKEIFAVVGADVSRDPVWRDSMPRVTWGLGGPSIRASAASSGYFETLGVPVIGRAFTRRDDVAATGLAIANAAFVHRRLGVEPDAALGHVLDLGVIRATLIGVVPADFHGPRRGDDYDLWLSFGALRRATALPPDVPLSSTKTTIYARLLPGVTPEESVRSAEALTSTGAFFRTLDSARYPPMLEPYHAQDALLAKLVVAISVLMLVGGALSLCLLEIARAEKQRGTLAIELSLGALPTRLIRRRLTESVLPGLIGTGCALVASHWVLSLSQGLRLPDGLPLALLHVTLTWSVLAFAAIASAMQIVTGVLVGGADALRRALEGVLRAQAPTATISTRSRARLLWAHAAITTVLLAGSFVFVRTVYNVTTIDLGFARNHVLELFVQPSAAQITASGVDLTGSFRSFIDELNHQPGVVRATNGSLPLRNPHTTSTVPADVWRSEVGPTYVEAGGLVLLAGRDLTAADADAVPKHVVVSESLAERFSPHLTIGSAFEVASTGSDAKTPDRFAIVGIVRDALRVGVAGAPVPVVYIPKPLKGDHQSNIMLSAVVRFRDDAARGVHDLDRLARARYPNAARLQIRTASDEIDDEFRGQFLAASLFSWYAVAAAAMVFVSVFGLLSVLAARGARELAIRRALGARPRSIVWTLCRRIAGPMIGGLAVGEGLAVLVVRSISAQLFGVSAGDVKIYVLTAVGLCSVTAVACWRPAVAALRQDPLQQLREG